MPLLVLIFVLCLSLTVSFAAPSSWAVSEIEKANLYGLSTKSVLSNYQSNITREEFAELAVKLYEAMSRKKAAPTHPNPFTDTANVEVLKANNLGIVGGVGGGLFAPTNTITREQIAAMFYRTITAANSNLTDGKYPVNFADKNEISDWALESVGFMNQKGILGGIGNNKVGPKGTATREQALALVTRTYEKFSDVETSSQTSKNEMIVHFIDVGQGDSILVVAPNGSTMLIDAGPRSAGDKLVSYLKKAGITTIDKFVATHAHEDHIGGAQHVFSNFTVEKVYDSGFVHTTKTYENFLTTIDQKNIDFEVAKKGNSINLDNNIKINILHPSAPMSDINDNSVVLHMTYDNISFMLTGDAEKKAEETILASNTNVKSTILKVGHHGSSTSTTQAFLNKINPEVAIIQVAASNSYGHPNDEILSRLSNSGVKIYRSDIHGDIVISTNGKTYTINAQPYIYQPFNEEPKPNTNQTTAPSGKINLNTASFEELQEIIHIGPTYAQRIIDARPFTSVNQLINISGIAEKRLADIIAEGKAYVD